jgi:hypothetical protein
MKICNICKQAKPLEDFYTRQRKTSVYYSYCCKQCHSQQAKQNYKTNPSPAIERTRKRNKQILTKIRKEKDKPCADCGIKYPHYVMEFDHKGNKKLFGIANKTGRKWETIKAEIDKCDVVCSNCHREREYGIDKRGQSK